MPFRLRRKSKSEETSPDKPPQHKSKRSSWLSSLKASHWLRSLKKDPIAEEVVPAIAGSKTVAEDESAVAPDLEPIESSTPAPLETTAKVGEGKRENAQAASEQPQVTQELSEEDVHSLFSGAPQFSVGQEQGQPHPVAAFPWDFALKVRDVSDCPPLAHPAFSASTIRRHLASQRASSDRDASIVGFNIGVAELPSMRSAQGNEPGTVGFEYFLQEAIADSLQLDRPAEADEAEEIQILENHALLQLNPERLGVRKFDLEHVVDRLVELSDMFNDFQNSTTKLNILGRQSPSELYTLLFSQLLMPPKFDNTTEDPTGLKVQIEALTRALKIKAIWYDFSSVEWRIRVGQILWTEAKEPNLSDSDSTGDGDGLADRDILLLQLVLACELLLRLDAIAALNVQEVKEVLHLTAEEIRSFQDIETRKTMWDLVFARRFLENIEPRRVTMSREPPKQQLASKLAFFSTASPHLSPATRQDYIDVMFLPKNPDQQLSGLFYFAKILSWPDSERVERELIEVLRINEEAPSLPSPSIYATPLSSPAPSNRSSGYFDTRPQASRTVTARSLQLQPTSPSLSIPNASPNGSPSSSPLLSAPKALIGGWLTRTCLTGFVLPGEAFSHFLISTLLENDAPAITALGDSANLYSGFIYKGRSWWSKACVVGRVLACLRGATECMGWISLPYVPTGFEDGWVDVKGTPVEDTGAPRIEDTDAISSDSDLVAGKDIGDLKPSDFTLPQDQADTPLPSIKFGELQLDLLEQSNLVDISTPSFSASLHFSSSSISNELGGQPNVSLQHLVTFVSAFPCTPPPIDKLQIVTSNGSNEASLGALPAHPLHVSQKYRIIPAATVLTKSLTFPLSGHEPAMENEVVVLDARADTVLELLSRAWCSSQGAHALISRVGTTCLACSVREARALALNIVIRIC